jgi:hypothetical protein
MATERPQEIDGFLTVLAEMTLKDRVAHDVVEELGINLAAGNLQILVREGMPIWRVADRGQRRAVLFIPKGISEAQIKAQLPDMLGDSLAILRGLPGPRLGEIELLKEELRQRISVTE